SVGAAAGAATCGACFSLTAATAGSLLGVLPPRTPLIGPRNSKKPPAMQATARTSTARALTVLPNEDQEPRLRLRLDGGHWLPGATCATGRPRIGLPGGAWYGRLT